jgi:hypothetical protein
MRRIATGLVLVFPLVVLSACGRVPSRSTDATRSNGGASSGSGCTLNTVLALRCPNRIAEPEMAGSNGSSDTKREPSRSVSV